MAMNKKYFWLAFSVIKLGICIPNKALCDEGMMPTNSNWHKLPASVDPMSHNLLSQIHVSPSSNSVIVVMSFRNGTAWTTNMEEFWRGHWVENTNGYRVQLNTSSNATNFIVAVQVGNFRLSPLTRNKFYNIPSGKFAKFELVDSNGHIIRPRPGAGTNLVKTIGVFNRFDLPAVDVYYQTNPPAWMLPSANSLVAEFPETVSTNFWPLFRMGVGRAYSAGLRGGGNPTQLYYLNLYNLYSITNEGDYKLSVQPVLYMQKNYDSEFLDRVDLPCVTTKVHLVPQVKQQ